MDVFINLLFVWTLSLCVYAKGDLIDVKEVEGLSLPAEIRSLTNFSLANARRSEVRFKLFKDKNDKGTYYDADSILNIQLDNYLPLKIFIHGWMTNEDSPWYEPLKNEYFKKSPHYIVYLDWSKAASESYNVATANTKAVANFVVDFIIATRTLRMNVHLIGHSLGAHLAGFIGKAMAEKTKEKIGRITALDAAGPKFMNADRANRLCDSDALFVDVVHTDDLYYGYKYPIGHVDFYPNGGFKQPGCPLVTAKDYQDVSVHEKTAVDTACNSRKAVLYFITSVNSTKFKALPANSWKEFCKGKYIGSEVIFGENISFLAKGTYFFHTKSNPPYYKNLKNCRTCTDLIKFLFCAKLITVLH